MSKISGNIEELANVDAGFMKALYEYREKIEKEERQESREVVIEFKKESMDPNRPIVLWEKRIREKLKKQKKIHVD